MMHRFIAGSAIGMLVLGTASVSAQQASAPTPAPLAIPNPTYTTLVLEMEVNRPIDAVWARVGKFCDVGEWLQTTCTIVSGAAGQLGAVRLVRNSVIELMVAKTDFSYTYTMPVRIGVPYNAAHGTLQAKPLTGSTTKLIYSFVYDNSMLGDDAARATEAEARRTRVTKALQNMKLLAEGGTLPPAPPPSAPH
jgi:hypothetical protein